MENQAAMSSSSSSTPIVAMEESKEKNNHLKLGSPQEVMSERRIENPSSGSYGAVRRGREIMNLYPSRSNKIYTCHFCKKGFSTSQALGGHQNAHKQEREWDKKRKAMEADFPGLAFLNPYTDKPHILLGGYSPYALSNENHLGITIDPFKRIVYPDMNMNMTIVPRVTPTRFFTGNTSSNGSTSRAPGLSLSSYNNMHPLIPRNNPTFAPPQTTFVSSKENVLREENFISKIGVKNVVEIDDDDDGDQPEEGNSESVGVNLSLSL